MVVCKSKEKYDGHVQICDRNMMVVCKSMTEIWWSYAHLWKKKGLMQMYWEIYGRMHIYEEIWWSYANLWENMTVVRKSLRKYGGRMQISEKIWRSYPKLLENLKVVCKWHYCGAKRSTDLGWNWHSVAIATGVGCASSPDILLSGAQSWAHFNLTEDLFILSPCPPPPSLRPPPPPPPPLLSCATRLWHCVACRDTGKCIKYCTTSAERSVIMVGNTNNKNNHYHSVVF